MDFPAGEVWGVMMVVSRATLMSVAVEVVLTLLLA